MRQSDCVDQIPCACWIADDNVCQFGLLANWAIVINLLVMFISMGVMAHSPPNYIAAQAGSAGAALGGASVAQNPDGTWPPVATSGRAPASSNGFIGGVNGLMQGMDAAQRTNGHTIYLTDCLQVSTPMQGPSYSSSLWLNYSDLATSSKP
jgi:hypothetical protein